MKLVILESYALREGDLDWSGLAALADEVDYYPRTPYDQIAARIGNAELVIVNKCCIDGPVLDACPNLRWVGVTATGTDSLDVEACRRRGVAVCNVPGYSTPSVAQLAVTLLLAGCQRLRDYDQSVRAGRWQLDLPAELSARPGIELAGKTLGIVGYGAIGRQVARVAAALDMQVLVHTRTPRPDADGVRFVSLETLLAESHAISLHCPATDATRHIIRRETLAKDGKFLYPVMEVVYEPCPEPKPEEYYVTPALLANGSPLVPEYLDRVTNVVEKIVTGHACAEDPTLPEYMAILEALEQTRDNYGKGI